MKHRDYNKELQKHKNMEKGRITINQEGGMEVKLRKIDPNELPIIKWHSCSGDPRDLFPKEIITAYRLNQKPNGHNIYVIKYRHERHRSGWPMRRGTISSTRWMQIDYKGKVLRTAGTRKALLEMWERW